MQNGSLRGPKEDVLPNAIIQDDDGRTALHEAATIGDEKTLNTLLNGGSNRNAKDVKHGNTPLHEAAWRGFSRCVKLLCSLPQLPKNVKNSKSGVNETRGALHSALLGTRNAGGFSALHLAAQNGHNQSCREILLAGADPDVQNNYGDTPLHTACRYGHAGSTRILISAKCDPNRTNLNGDAPLHISCAMGRRKLTRILLEAGGNNEIKNAQNETPKDIAIRKKLNEILEILNSPIEIKQQPQPHSKQQSDRERSSSNSKSNRDKGEKSDKVDGKSPHNHHKSRKHRTDLVANPVNWSPYGCHYFPDPRTFPSPKLETLPKEPLIKGEQYYLDLGGNIRKGPVGVGNTCYCGPFFRHIEERISKNRKSIKKYVHKATERLDNKVQALAIKTDDQIEQLTRSMMADRIRCEGRRIHLEQWLKRGEPLRVTTGGHHMKSKKNSDNVNTLTRCKSLELLADDELFENRRIVNSKSYDILDESHVIIHRDAEPLSNELEGHSSIVTSDKLHNRNSDRSRSRSSGGNIEPNKLFERSDPQAVSQRLEELLAKTNQILEMEKIARKRRKEALLAVGAHEKLHKKRNKERIYSDNNLINKLKRTSIGESIAGHSNKHLYLGSTKNNSEFIEKEMKKITSSLSRESEEKLQLNGPPIPSFTPENGVLDYGISQKELERKCDQEHEKSSILSGSSHKNPSSLGSGYIPEFNQQLRVSRTSRPASTDRSQSQKSFGSNHQQDQSSPLAMALNFSQDYQNVTEAHEADAERKFKDLISALRKDYHSTREAIEAQIKRRNIEDAESEEDDDEGSANEDEDDGNVDGNEYKHDEYYSEEQIDGNEAFQHSAIVNGGFFQNDCFDEALSSPNNTLKSQKPSSKIGKDQDETATGELSEMAKTSEINELKNRILNGSNWRSQVLKKTKQFLNVKDSNEEQIESTNNSNGVNVIVKKFEIKNGEIKTLKPPSAGILRRSKVQELVAKIQGKDSPVESIENGQHTDTEEESEDEHQNSTVNDPTNLLTNQITNEDTNHSHYYYKRAQPQVANLTPLYPKSTNHQQTPNSNTFLLDARNLIPKDAYFHELPNKNRMRPIADKLPEKQMLNFTNNNANDDYIKNVSPTLLASRTRNPLPYMIEEYADIPVINNGYLDKQHYGNYSNANVLLGNGNNIEENKNMVPPSPAVRNHLIQHEKLLANRKFAFSSAVDYELSRINYNQQQQQAAQPTVLLTAEQAQFERDLSNDSGFSTKICGSSLGPSPSLSGHTEYGVMTRNGSNNIVNGVTSNGQLPNGGTNGHPVDNNIQYFIGNTSSLV